MQKAQEAGWRGEAARKPEDLLRPSFQPGLFVLPSLLPLPCSGSPPRQGPGMPAEAFLAAFEVLRQLLAWPVQHCFPIPRVSYLPGPSFLAVMATQCSACLHVISMGHHVIHVRLLPTCLLSLPPGPLWRMRPPKGPCLQAVQASGLLQAAFLCLFVEMQAGGAEKGWGLGHPPFLLHVEQEKMAEGSSFSNSSLPCSLVPLHASFFTERRRRRVLPELISQ